MEALIDESERTPALTPSGLWAIIERESRPSPDRWRTAARTAIAGLAIIALESTLWMELIYPAMTVMLVLTHLKAARTLTHTVLNLVGAIVGVGLAIVIGSLFIQQPWFYLACVFATVTGLMYFWATSRYPGCIFVCTYLFLVACFTMIFDRAHAEQTAFTVFRSGGIGVIVTGLVTLLLWPKPAATLLREQLANSIARPLRALEAIQASARASTAVATPDPGNVLDPLRITESIEIMERAETDAQFRRDDRPVLMNLIGAIRTLASAVARTSDALAGQSVDRDRALPTVDAAAEVLRALHGALSGGGSLEAFETACARAGALDAEATLPSVRPLAHALLTAENARMALDGLARLEAPPDPASVLVGNLRECLGGIFRERLAPLNDAAFAHGAKCAMSIIVCLLFCIAMGWTHGIGCVETIILVVQATLGGTIVIGALRLVGIATAALIATGVIAFLIPTIATLPALLLVFAPLLFAVGYAMGGSERAATPAVQTMIAVDFMLLQVPRPSIDLYPVMNFSLAIGMAVLVTFIVYHFVWRVRAIDRIPVVTRAMRDEVDRARSLATMGRLSVDALWRATARVDAQYPQLLRLHEDARIDAPRAANEEEARLSSINAAHDEATAALQELMQRAALAPTTS